MSLPSSIGEETRRARQLATPFFCTASRRLAAASESVDANGWVLRILKNAPFQPLKNAKAGRVPGSYREPKNGNIPSMIFDFLKISR